MKYFEDVEVGSARETASRTIQAAEMIAFARQYDPQFFHIDPEAAKGSIYGGLIASGWHTASVMMRLMVDGFVNDTAGMGSPGFDDLRWHAPVRPGDTIRVRSTLVEKTPSKSRPDIGSCRYRTEVLNQRDEVVLSLTSIGLVRRRPAK